MGRAQIEENDWGAVADRRKRKQIQDRLAQRARRKRLSEAKRPDTQQSDSIPEPGTSHPSEDGGWKTTSMAFSEKQASPHQPAGKGSCLLPDDHVSLDVVWVPSVVPQRFECPLGPMGSAPTFIGEAPLNIYAAIHQNGLILGLPCSVVVPGRSRPSQAHVPESLRPSVLQLSTIHPPWVDRFPFPKWRDNFIALLGIIDEEEFLKDMFCMTSFVFTSGAASWDPSAYKMGRQFYDKWGYLFY